MNTRMFLRLLPSLIVGSNALLAAQALDFRQLPAAVQQAINSQRGPAGIVSIDKTYRFGSPVYDVHLDQPAPDNELLITETGTVIDANSVLGSRTDVIQTRPLLFNALPTPVQNSIRAQVGDVPVPNVEAITCRGQTSYVVPARMNQELVDLWIDPNGNILTLTPPRVLLSHPSRLDPDQLPAAVQETLRNFAGSAPILSVLRGSVQGRTVYDALFAQDGRNVELRMAEDGSLVRDTVNDRYLAETGRMTRAGLAANAPARLPLSQAVTVSFNQLPVPVASTVQRYAGSDYIYRIEKGFVRGEPQYEALFRHFGNDVALRIAQDGGLIHDRINETFLAQQSPSVIVTAPNAVGGAPIWQTQTGTLP